MDITNRVMWVDNLPFISGNALPYTASIGNFSDNQLLNIDNNAVMWSFQQLFPGDYHLVWRDYDDKWPSSGVTIKFNKSEDEMWFRLKHG